MISLKAVAVKVVYNNCRTSTATVSSVETGAIISRTVATSVVNWSVPRYICYNYNRYQNGYKDESRVYHLL